MTDLHWSEGKRALSTRHRSLVAGDVARRLDLDAQLASRDPHAARWDDAVESGSGRGRRGAAIEVHNGDASQVSNMIATKNWAVRVLTEFESDLAVVRWHWVVPTDARFTFLSTDRRARQLAAAGVERPR